MITDRIHLAKHFAELGFQVGVEIGVCKGEYSSLLLASNPELRLYSVDPWVAYGFRTQSWCDKEYSWAKHNLKKFGRRSIIVRMTSMQALDLFPDESLDFVYIDGAHDFENVYNDLCGWAPKVRPGGIVSGHDYLERTGSRGSVLGVVQAVDQYTDEQNIRFELTKEKLPSFYWVKK